VRFASVEHGNRTDVVDLHTGQRVNVAAVGPDPDERAPLQVSMLAADDVLSVFDGRIALMLAEDSPEFGWWDHEAAVEADAYEKQVPAEVAVAIAANAATLSATLAAVPDDAWDRTGTRRDGELFTVLGAGRFALHEGTHHLLDIGRVLRSARGR